MARGLFMSAAPVIVTLWTEANMIRAMRCFGVLLLLVVAGCTGRDAADQGRISLLEGRVSFALPAEMARASSRKQAEPVKLSDDGRPISFVDKAGVVGLIVSFAATKGGNVSAFHASLLVRSMAAKRPDMRVLDSGKRLISGARAGYAVYEAPSTKDNPRISVHHLTLVDLPDGLLRLLVKCPVAHKDACERYAAQISESLIIAGE